MGTPTGPSAADMVPLPERSFYEQQFAGTAIVVSLTAPDQAAIDEVCRAATSLARADARLVLVVGDRAPVATGADPGPERAATHRLVDLLASVIGQRPVVLDRGPDPAGRADDDTVAELWLAVHDRPSVVVAVPFGHEAATAAEVATEVRALKLVITDPIGGWGDPPRSFADVIDVEGAFRHDLAGRQGGAVVPAIDRALAGGVVNANLCRARDLDRELFTFDGTGTLFTRGGYLRLDRLRVDDLPAVEALVDQGVSDGLLRPRTRLEVARLAVTGLGARVTGGDHLAGIVSLERKAYEGTGLGEVACLYAVSRFSAAGAGGLLVDGLIDQAVADGLAGVFAVTVSDAAAAFFGRKGFVEVDHDALPSAKWDGYDPDRKATARAFLREID